MEQRIPTLALRGSSPTIGERFVCTYEATLLQFFKNSREEAIVSNVGVTDKLLASHAYALRGKGCYHGYVSGRLTKQGAIKVVKFVGKLSIVSKKHLVDVLRQTKRTIEH